MLLDAEGRAQPRVRRERRIGGEQRPALTAADSLAPVEGQAGHRGQRTRLAALVRRADRAGGVLDEEQAVAVRDRLQLRVVGGQADRVHRDHTHRSGADQVLDRLRVDRCRCRGARRRRPGRRRRIAPHGREPGRCSRRRSPRRPARRRARAGSGGARRRSCSARPRHRPRTVRRARPPAPCPSGPGRPASPRRTPPRRLPVPARPDSREPGESCPSWSPAAMPHVLFLGRNPGQGPVRSEAA